MFAAAARSLASTTTRRAATRSSTGIRAASSTAARSTASTAPTLLALTAASIIAASSATFESKNGVVQCDKIPVYGVPGTNRERTFLAVKPDGVQRGLVGEKKKDRLEIILSSIKVYCFLTQFSCIISYSCSCECTANNNNNNKKTTSPQTYNSTGDIIARFEKRGYKLVGLKMVWPTNEMAQNHYKDLSKKPFYPSLCKFFSSGPIICMCWEGKDIIKQGRQMLGETQPLASKPG
eukprot:scaffold47872_cov53-Cyclotella_meneghiniana.AAC.1